MPRIRPLWPLLILLALTVCVFHQSFFAELVYWDDDVFILRNDILKMPFWQAIKVSFSSYYHGDYLPLTIMSYWIDVNLWGENAQALHATNLVLHLLNITLVYLIIRKLKQSVVFALTVALIFAIHPLQTEAVVWVSERKSLLSGLFTLCSVLIYLYFIETKKKQHLIFSYAFYFLSILAKTTAILLPLVFLVIDRMSGSKKLKKSLLQLAPLFMAVLIFGYIRVISYDYSTPGISESLFMFERVLMIPPLAAGALWFYIQKYFWPTSLSAMYPFWDPSGGGYFQSIGAIFIFGVLGYLIFRKDLKASKIFLTAVVVFLLPILHIIPRANFANDRYMYLPIIGFTFCLFDILGSFLKFERHPKILWSIIIIMFVPLAWGSYERSKVWKTNLSLWQDAVLKNPDNILARNALGLEYHTRKQYEDAIVQYSHVLKLEVETELKLKSINNLANIFVDRSYKGFNLNQAIQLYELAISTAERPNLTYELRINYAQTLYQQGQKERCREILLQVYKEVLQNPDSRHRWLLDYVSSVLKTLSF